MLTSMPLGGACTFQSFTLIYTYFSLLSISCFFSSFFRSSFWTATSGLMADVAPVGLGFFFLGPPQNSMQNDIISIIIFCPKLYISHLISTTLLKLTRIIVIGRIITGRLLLVPVLLISLLLIPLLISIRLGWLILISVWPLLFLVAIWILLLHVGVLNLDWYEFAINNAVCLMRSSCKDHPEDNESKTKDGDSLQKFLTFSSNVFLFFRTHLFEHITILIVMIFTLFGFVAEVLCEAAKSSGGVILLPFFLIRQNLVRLANLFKFSFISFADIGVIGFGEFVIGLLDFSFRGIFAYPQNKIVILACVEFGRGKEKPFGSMREVGYSQTSNCFFNHNLIIMTFHPQLSQRRKGQKVQKIPRKTQTNNFEF